MLGFGPKWVVVSVKGDKVILTNNRKILSCSIEGDKISYPKEVGRFPREARKLVEEVIANRKKERRI